MPFLHRHRVTYADCTLGNHVYYARYLEILEAARNEFVRSLGQPCLRWQQEDIILPVIEVRVRYRAPARYDDLLAVEVRLTEAERVRLSFAYRVVNQREELILDGETHHVCTGLNERPKRLPLELLAALRGP